MFRNKINYLLFLLLLLLPAAAAQASGTNVSSNITSPVWTEANSPYVVTGTIEVTKGATLRIEAGTEVKFATSSKILVNGELQILGTAENPVVLTSAASQPKSGDWDGIEFTDKSVNAKTADGEYVSGSIVRNAIIKFSKGISCDDASPYIANNQFSLNKVGLEIKGDNYSAGGLVLDASSANQNSSLTPIYVKNNTFSDNDLGIRISRNNGRNYVATPAGYSYLGVRRVTAYIQSNTINSNGSGLEILNGDNNVLTANSIKYNFTTGVKVGESSRGNLLSKNTINNNNLGLDIASANSLVLQNNIKNNFQIGVKLAAKPTAFTLNNIYNNQSYNLDNRVYNLAATNNYWGSVDQTAIEASFWTKGDVTTTTSTAAMVYPVKYVPFLTEEAGTGSLFKPIILTDLISTSTVFSKQELSGIKPIGAAVYINDTLVVPADDQSEWSYTASLQLGTNLLAVDYRDQNGLAGESRVIEIKRVNQLSAPTLSAMVSSTTAEKLVLSGTKPTNSGIFMNGRLVTAIDSATTWKYEVALTKGDNNFSLMAKDDSGGSSEEVTITIERKGASDSEVIAEEKKLATKADTKLAAKLSGRLLLQVEKAGLIWYIYPLDNKRYFISQESALDIFRRLALGISEANLNLIPTDSKTKGNTALRNRLKGRLLLRTEAGGQISYVDLNGYRHDITAANLMENFRALSLGITNANLRKLVVGELK